MKPTLNSITEAQIGERLPTFHSSMAGNNYTQTISPQHQSPLKNSQNSQIVYQKHRPQLDFED